MKDLRPWVNSLVVSLILMTLTIQVNANSDPEEFIGSEAGNLTSKMFILSVGIGNYDNSQVSDLPYPTNDAKEVYVLLDSLKSANPHLYTEEKTGEKFLLLNSDATRENIYNRLKDISDAVNPGDVVMIYLAGHGIQVLNDDAYFLPYGIKDINYPETYAIKYKEITEKLHRLVDKECIPIVFVDACYSGSMYEKSVADFVGYADPSIIGFYSSTKRQKSADVGELKHGLFTDALLKGLRGAAKNGQGNITIRSLANFIENEVKENAVKYLHGAVQTPKLDNRGEDHYVLFGNSSEQSIASERKNYTEKNADREYLKPFVVVNLSESADRRVSLSYYVSLPYSQYRILSESFLPEEKLDSARYMLGNMYYRGECVSKDIPLAKQWLEAAAKNGHVNAQYALGELLFEEKEYKQGLFWLEKAAHFTEQDIKRFKMDARYAEKEGWKSDEDAPSLEYQIRRNTAMSNTYSYIPIYILGRARGYNKEQSLDKAYEMASFFAVKQLKEEIKALINRKYPNVIINDNEDFEKFVENSAKVVLRCYRLAKDKKEIDAMVSVVCVWSDIEKYIGQDRSFGAEWRADLKSNIESIVEK